MTDKMASKTLFIVESPGKIKKIKSILGDNYIVMASVGHCRDLQSKTLSIDVENNFEPLYTIIPGKKKIIDDMKRIVKKCSNVILAMDDDREGEMIASGLRDLLGLKNPDRVIFHSITKKDIFEALKKPIKINENMVYAQQARRLLDRLVGFRISPLLWKTVKGQLSAGRVQSVVVKIIIDKENEIKEFINSNENGSYYKTSGIFTINDNDRECYLYNNNDLYKFEADKIKPFLKQFNKETKYKIIKISHREKKSIPPKPFITSTLQQDASTKFKFTPKRTMGIAQKLYEAGYITYMRTDSFILSDDVLGQCKKYVIAKYGKDYYKFRQFKNKGGAQEAHEAIRPTKISVDSIDMTADCNKLYSLIWKRTVASQMSDANINVCDVNIDCLNGDKSILPDDCYFGCNIETIIFNGYLILYDKVNENIEKIDKGCVSMVGVSVVEEYEKPPLRYNQAGLIKYLEKSGIGRPSTYASIMDKIITRGYVCEGNVDGIEKESNTYTLSGKTFRISNKVKKIFIGKESKKIIPTQLGISVNNFMVEHFDKIMDIKYTSNMEDNLDKVADGKIKWYNLLDICYKQFNPKVVELEKSVEHISNTNKTEVFIGKHPDNGMEIYSLIGRYGLCVRMDKQFAPIKNCEQKDITLEMAVKLFEYPKVLGKIGKSIVKLCKGQYGLYFKIGSKNVAIKDKERELTLEYAKELYETEPGAIKTFRVKNQVVYLKNGKYGYYLQFNTKGKRKNKALPKDIDIEQLNNIDKYI
jgi:DNA topoisomerase-1